MVSETIEETYSLAADGRVELSNVNGRIEIEAWGRDEVSLRAEKHAAGEEALEDLKVKIDARGDRLVIRTQLSESLFNWLKNKKQRVDYQLTVPEGVRLEVSSVNGKMRVADVLGGGNLKSVNGALIAERLAGDLDLSSVNGGITLELRAEGGEGNVSLSAVNGGISILAPEGAGGELSARTVNGGFSSEVPFDREEKGFGPTKKVEGRFGEGGPRMEAHTVNGGIRIRLAEDSGV
jgi:DUF4097 and DUF4098 domain-containing protein YvlB